MSPTTVLFTGYAPVHFLCFRPLFERLRRRSDVRVYVSGGLRTRTDDGVLHDASAMYGPLGVHPDHILTVEEIERNDFDLLFAANTKLIEPRSVGTRVQIFHGISFRNRSAREANMGCDAYFLVGPYMRRRFANAGLLPADDPRGLSIGFMKTDHLLNHDDDRGTLLDRYGFSGDRPVLLYAPTGLKHNSLETMGPAVIERLVATGRYDLLIKPHDHPKNSKIDWFHRLASLQGSHCRVTRDRDVIPMLRLANLLITDASSVANEYALLDRPIVFLDVPKLLRRARNAAESGVDLETWGRRIGILATGPEVIDTVVEASLNERDATSEMRRRMVDDMFYNPGRATEAALCWLQDRLSAAPRPRCQCRQAV